MWILEAGQARLPESLTITTVRQMALEISYRFSVQDSSIAYQRALFRPAHNFAQNSYVIQHH